MLLPVDFSEPSIETLSLVKDMKGIKEENVSLIIISTLGKGMFRELLLGGTARDVVRRTNRSVLAIRAGKLYIR